MEQNLHWIQRIWKITQKWMGLNQMNTSVSYVFTMVSLSLAQESVNIQQLLNFFFLSVNSLSLVKSVKPFRNKKVLLHDLKRRTTRGVALLALISGGRGLPLSCQRDTACSVHGESHPCPVQGNREWDQRLGRDLGPEGWVLSTHEQTHTYENMTCRRTTYISKNSKMSQLYFTEINCPAPDIFHDTLRYSRPPRNTYDQPFYPLGTTVTAHCDSGFDLWDFRVDAQTSTHTAECVKRRTASNGYTFTWWNVPWLAA